MIIDIKKLKSHLVFLRFSCNFILQFTFSEPARKKLEQKVKCVQSYGQEHDNGVIGIILVLFLLTLIKPHTFVLVSSLRALCMV